jgi:type IV secretion system protein VirD4
LGKTAKSILISCGARLAVFDIQELREITAYDELELDTIGDRKTALFLIMSDTDATFNFLISMIYTQLFNLLCEKADDVYGGRLPVHVRCLIDEAANIGQIPNLEKLVATIRSREISACLVLQTRSQFKAIYKDNADTIIGNMDSQIFLGGSEPTTLKELAEAPGKETIDTFNTSDTRGNSPSYGTNYQKLGKELLHLFVKSSVAQSENSRTGTRSTGFLSQIKAYQNWYSFRMEECDDRIETADPGERDLVYACRGLLYPESDTAGRRKKHRKIWQAAQGISEGNEASYI